MLPESSSMSSVEGYSDEELPCVSLSQSTCSKSELEMPPASEVASLRAREDAAERALQNLRDSCNDPLLISLSRSTSQGSSGEEGEAALSAAVSALQVAEQPGVRGIKDHLQLLTAIRDHLPVDSPILNEYIRVLEEKPERAEAITEVILCGVSSSLISGRAPADLGVVVCVLCMALRGRRGSRARRALHALLDARQSRALAAAVSAAVEDAEQLLAAHDAVRNGARGGADRLAAALLAHATARVLPAQENSNAEPPAPLSPESVSLVRSSWRKLSTRAQLTLLRCAGRALAAASCVGDKSDIEDNQDILDKEDIEDSKDVGVKEDTGEMDIDNQTDIAVEGTESMSGIDTVELDNIKTEDTNITEDIGDTKAEEITEGFKTEDTDTRDAERQGGAALLAALSQPLPRASAFQLDRQQVLTNVSKLQLLFRSRFIPDSENDLLVETHFNCSQTSIDSMDTPIKLDTTIKKETPIKVEIMTPKKKEIKVKIPTELLKIKLDNPIKMPVKMELMNDLTEPKTKVQRIGTRVKGAQLKLDGFFEQITPVKIETDDVRSPERKRVRRERLERQCAQRSRRS